jgi:hypothetical protein
VINKRLDDSSHRGLPVRGSRPTTSIMPPA